MPKDVDVDSATGKAKEKEEGYQWLEAARFYEQALSPESQNTLLAAEIWARIGNCYARASTQAESLEEFRRTRQKAVEAYVKAARLFEDKDDFTSQGKSAHYYAIAKYVHSWLASNPEEKRNMLDECVTLGKKSLEAFKNAGEELNYGKMCNDLLMCLLERLYVAADWNEMKKVTQEGTDCAEEAVAILSKIGDNTELLRAYFTASLLNWYVANITEQEERIKALVQKSLSCSENGLKLSEEVDNLYYAAMSNWAAAFCTLFFTEKTETAVENAEDMLQKATILRDNYLKGVALYVLAFAMDWMVLKEGDPDKKKEGYEKIAMYAEDAIRYLKLVSQDFFIAQTCSYYAESYSSQAREVEANLEEKRSKLAKAVEIGRQGLEHATRSGSPDAVGSVLHALSKALHFYSNLVTEKDEKTKLLEEALTHRKEYVNIVETVFPSSDWIRGLGKNYEGLIKADLARIEIDKTKKATLWKSAISDMENGIAHCAQWISTRPVPSLIVAVAGFEDTLGGILNEFYHLTEDKENLTKAIKVYDESSKKFKEVKLSSRVAEAHWKMAGDLDNLGEHQKAAEIFENAQEEYRAAAQSIPHFAEFYQGYAEYMRAWSEIERARHAHKNEDYETARKYYEETANILKPTKMWSYLSSNFLAWALLEQAEDLSRKERNMESIEHFNKAAQFFTDAQEEFEKEIGKTKVLDEKEKAIELSKVSLRRKDYCLARAEVEQARIHDKQGDYEKSAEKYDLAASTFEKIMDVNDSKIERKEIELITCMCRAWQKMKIADGRDIPEFYHEASELFLKAKEHSTKDRTSLLASGNNALCKALEFATRFEETRNQEDFTKAKQFLGSATNYYLKAGFENTAQWTGATEILLDAYYYMSIAETEIDPDKRTKAYLISEKCLGRAAALYETAGYLGKREEVLQTLKKVKEKREFSLSLGELLAAPSDASSTSIIDVPSSTAEEPVGFSKFEGAFVEANLIIPQREVVFGENLLVEMHFANLGKDTAFLIRIDDVIPEGLELVEKPSKSAVEDGFLNFRGKKLAALEAEEMKLTFKPKKKGVFAFKPKIQYMNEAGEHKSCELEQATVTVKQMGIRGWLRGPG